MSSPPATLLELLPLHAMGALDETEAAAVERALVEHPGLRVELARWHEALAALGETPAPAAPTAAVRIRLLASLAAPAPAGRFDHFATQVAALFDLTIDGARAALARIDDAAAWKPMMAGVDSIGVSAGPRWTGNQCCLVRLAAGTTFPRHRHTGEEASLGLHGGAHMSDGRDLRPGDLLVVDESVEHDFVVDDDGDGCIFAVRAHGIVPLTPVSSR